MNDQRDVFGLPPLKHNNPPEPTLFDRVRDLVGNANKLARRAAIDR